MLSEKCVHRCTLTIDNILYINYCHMPSLFLLLTSCALVLIIFFVLYLRCKECSMCISKKLDNSYRHMQSNNEKNSFKSFYYFCLHILFIYFFFNMSTFAFK